MAGAWVEERTGTRDRGLGEAFGVGSPASRALAAAAVAGLVGACWVVAYTSGGARIAPHVFYLPILMAGARLGPAGTLLTTLTAAVVTGPLLPLDVDAGVAQPLSDWVSRGAFFAAIGLFAQHLFGRLRQSESDLFAIRGAARRERDDLRRRLDEERRELLSRVAGAQEEERRRIAADLHDDSIQVMSALRMRLGALRRRLTEPEAREQLDMLEETAHDAVVRLRRLMFDLYPWQLDGRGLVETIRQALPDELARHGIAYELKGTLGSEPTAETGSAIYRIIREALQNIRKHARASGVRIAVSERKDEMSIEVSDDGVGFAGWSPEPGHLGLVSMRERAEALGGRCTISSSPGAGTTVRLELPLR